MQGPIIGNFFGLYVQGKRVALAQAKSVSFKTATENITTDDSQGYEEIIPTIHNFSSSVDGLVCAHLDNYLQFPEDLTKSGWTKDSAVTISPNYGSDRKGQLRGNRIVFNAGSLISQVITPDLADTYWASLYAKGSGRINLIITDGVTTQTLSITLTSDWTRYAISIQGDTDDLTFRIQKDTATTLDVCDTMVSRGTVLADYKGSQLMAKELMNYQINKTKVQTLWSNDLDGDTKITVDAYISGFDLKTKNDTVTQFSCSLAGKNAATFTEI